MIAFGEFRVMIGCAKKKGRGIVVILRPFPIGRYIYFIREIFCGQGFLSDGDSTNSFLYILKNPV